MADALKTNDPNVIARFQFEEDQYPLLLSVASLFADLELAHDFAVLVSYDEYRRYRFGEDFWRLESHRVQEAHRLRTRTILKQSPLLLEVVISAVGGIWALVQIIDKVANWKLNRQKLELEVAKLAQEHALKEVEIIEKANKLQDALRAPSASEICQLLVQRLSKSELRLCDLDLHSAGSPDSNA